MFALRASNGTSGSLLIPVHYRHARWMRDQPSARRRRRPLLPAAATEDDHATRGSAPRGSAESAPGSPDRCYRQESPGDSAGFRTGSLTLGSSDFRVELAPTPVTPSLGRGADTAVSSHSVSRAGRDTRGTLRLVCRGTRSRSARGTTGSSTPSRARNSDTTGHRPLTDLSWSLRLPAVLRCPLSGLLLGGLSILPSSHECHNPVTGLPAM